uniref:J domain-containing protein n=1 Tax=Kalanchoe fedtschenkoi TaxID=63787 RepID=A0A7N0ZX85_KALFE
MNGTLAALSSSNSLFLSPVTLPVVSTNYSTRNASFPRGASVKSSVQTCPEPTARKPKASSLYEVLQVSRDATQVQIKSAYRTLAKTCHPDASSHSSDGQDFIEINKAYLTLSDPDSRALYDMKLGFGMDGPFGYSGRAGFSPAVRRWETDQCW